MNLYSVFFIGLYVVLYKGAKGNATEIMQDSAVYASIMLILPVFFNMESIHLVIMLINKKYYSLNLDTGIFVGVLFMIFNLIYFLSQKRYLILFEIYSALPKKRKIIYMVLSWGYYLLSIVLFFMLLQMG